LKNVDLMDTNEDLLDTPLEEGTSNTNGSYRYTSETMLRLDFGISVVLIVLSLLAGMAALFDAGIIMVMMISGFFLGSYQLLSALIGGIRGNRKKLIYLAVSVGYLFAFYGFFDAVEDQSGQTFVEITLISGLIIVPLAFAFYYAKLCYDLIKEQQLYD
jgi:hypothetical protein